MKIADVKTWVVGNPPPHAGGRYFIFVRLTTDDGITGYGEAYAATFSPHLIANLIEDTAARYLEGQDPHDISQLQRRCYSAGFSQRPDITMGACFSSLEMACWDIIGKASNSPVHKLLGGQVHQTLRTYTYLYPTTGSVYPNEADASGGRNVYNDPELAAQAALACIEQGFDAIKFDPAGPYTVNDGHMPALDDIDLSAKMCAAIREAVGTGADICFGTHGQFTSGGAKRLAKAIEPFDPLWFEEPVPPDSPEAMAEVAASTSIPVAAGERLTGRAEFARLIDLRAASILQPNTGRSGGILETRFIAAMAEPKQIQIAPHCYCGPLVAAANIQVAAASPNFLILEAIKRFDGFHADLLVHPIDWQEGRVIVPDAPGLGVELDETVCDANPWRGEALHLEMQG